MAGLRSAFEAKQYREVLAAAPGVPRTLERDGIWLAALALEHGPEAAVAFAAKDLPVDARRPEEHRRALAGATYRCMAVRRYDAARVLFAASLDALPADSDSKRKFRDRYGLYMAALFSGLRRREDLQIPRSDPRSPVIQWLALIFGLPDDAGRYFASDIGVSPPVSAPRAGVPLPGGAEVGLESFLMPPETQFDVFLAAADFSTAGDPDSGWRLRVTHPFTQATLEFFVVTDGEKTQIVGMATPSGPPLLWRVGTRARRLAEAGDVASARRLVVWAHETVGKSTDVRWSEFLERSTPDAVATAEGVRQAADALADTRPRLERGGPQSATPSAASGLGEYAAVTFGEGMTRPILQSSPNGRPAPDYPREAREAGLSGLVIVKCIITVEGRAVGCTIIKGLGPPVDQVVLRWLAGASWSPVTFQGRPQSVRYVFNFSFSLHD